jgi:hypothetical protein
MEYPRLHAGKIMRPRASFEGFAKGGSTALLEKQQTSRKALEYRTLLSKE